MAEALKTDHGTTKGGLLLYAAETGSASTVGELLRGGAKPNERNVKGKTALMLAAQEGHAQVCRLLIENGASIDKKDQAGHSALHLAASRDHVHVCRLLLDKHAKGDMDKDKANSALHLAILKGHLEVACLLLENGGRLEQKGNGGLTALEAARRKDEKMASLLERHAAAFREADGAPAMKRPRLSTVDPEEDWPRFEHDYEVLDTLGSGTFGTVLRARSKLTNVEHAVKQIQIEFSAVGRRHEIDMEAKILSSLKHKNIIQYEDAWPEKNPAFRLVKPEIGGDVPTHYLYIVTELCMNDTLEKRLDRGLLVDKLEKLFVCQQIASAVAHIHSRYKMHRDLKPANIFFSQSNQIKVGDFGLATMVSIQDGRSVHQKGGAGTPIYFSPEQAAKQEYGRSAEIFTLGLIFYEVLGVVPRKVQDRFNIFQNLRSTGKLPQEPQKGTEFELIQKMIAKNKDDRPVAAEVKNEINDLLRKCH